MAKVTVTKAEREAAENDRKAVVCIYVDTTNSGQPGGEMGTTLLVDHATAKECLEFMMGLSRKAADGQKAEATKV